MIDFAKAFDHINHSIVLRKLKEMGVPIILLQWIHAFLYHRQQRVKIGSHISDWCFLNGGVPQGTKLAILLFLVMINDLKLICPTIKFVDNVTTTEGKPIIGPNAMGGALNEVHDWSKLNDMNANPSKTKRLQVCFTREELTHHELIFNGVSVQFSKEARLLGVIIQNDLKWDSHVHSIVTKASQRLHCLRILKRSGYNDSQLIDIYSCKIRSIVEYACQVWHPGLTQSQCHDIERVQVRAMRIIKPRLDYWKALELFDMPYLEERRVTLCKRLYEERLKEDNIIHDLLPSVRKPTYNFTHHKSRVTTKTRVKRTDNSFIQYAINKFE